MSTLAGNRLHQYSHVLDDKNTSTFRPLPSCPQLNWAKPRPLNTTVTRYAFRHSFTCLLILWLFFLRRNMFRPKNVLSSEDTVSAMATSNLIDPSYLPSCRRNMEDCSLKRWLKAETVTLPSCPTCRGLTQQATGSCWWCVWCWCCWPASGAGGDAGRQSLGSLLFPNILWFRCIVDLSNFEITCLHKGSRST